MFKKTSLLVRMGFSLISNKRIVIIGCGAGGGTAAQFARKTDRKASISIFEKGKYSQYSKCGLPYVLSGDITDFNDLIEFSKDWFQKERIDLFLETIVEEIDSKNKIVIAKKDGEQIKKEYDILIITTGAKPSIPPIQNIQKNGKLLDGVFVLRTIDSGKKISDSIKKSRKAIIVGAGLIGLEVADSLYKKGMEVIVVEVLPTILGNALDNDMCESILSEINEKIDIITNQIVIKAEEKEGKIVSIVTKDKITNKIDKIETDMLIITAGAKPETQLAENINCKIGQIKGIVVNQRSETTIKNVYAAGDCTQYIDFVKKEPLNVGLGSIVVRQAIAAGINAAGGNYNLPEGFLLTRTSKIFGIEIAAVGPVKENSHNIPITYSKFKGSSLPGYYPGGKPIAIKIGVHEETGRILSAQAVGNNASQRINTMACAILGKINVEDLKKLETAYAPPIAPTLDVLTLVCDVASLKRQRKQRKIR